MGWLRFTDGDDDWSDEHEGFVQGVVRDGWSWRDLGLDDDERLHASEFSLQIVCTCGWRTQRMAPPLGAEWAPCSVFLSKAQEDEAATIWSAEHRDTVTGPHRSFPRTPSLNR